MTSSRGSPTMWGMDLTSKIEMLLLDRAWSRRELARRIKRPHQNVQNWCSGKEPGRSDLLRIARAFGVPVEYLIDDAQDRPPPPAITPEEQTLLDVIRRSGRSPVEVLAILGGGYSIACLLRRTSHGSTTDSHVQR